VISIGCRGDSLPGAPRRFMLAQRLFLNWPANGNQREAALAGGLMSYGTSLTDAYHQIGM
jgi:hypothetical protein